MSDSMNAEEKNVENNAEKDTQRTETDLEIIKYAKALSNMFGVYPIVHLKEVWDFNHPRKPVAPAAIKQALDKTTREEDGIYNEMYIDGLYIISTKLPEYEDYVGVIETYEPGETYYIASKDDIDLYENGTEEAAFGTVEYHFMRNFIAGKMGRDVPLTDSDEEVDALMKKLLRCALLDLPEYEVIADVDEAGLVLYEEEPRFLKLYRDWVYGVRTWPCRGYKPEELRIEHIQNKNIFHIAQDEPFDYKKVKIGRNEKCPCGSGKKFKACCARVIQG